MRHLLTVLIGVLFGTGISLSGMANPAKVLNFFDVFGPWDPSLGLVMAGAVMVTFVGYKLVLKRRRPVFEQTFEIPENRNLDARLITGAGLFGLGWGLAGFCPGGALPALGTGNREVGVFVVALIAGLLITRVVLMRVTQGQQQKQPAE
ncbi:YeeE/YedE family protein [uncultured Roseobacter sp.]|uniref:YeeE/YedE family protein n=1 Tax=uncultured Roseobacter sp. TaxID=114847 RepID=UPI00262E3730|nr:YeeE/YedE family protein [uncultured Roseobacter sp.]